MKNERPLKTMAPVCAKSGGIAYSAVVCFNLIISCIFSVIILTANISGSDAAKYLGYISSPIAIAAVFCIAVCGFKQPIKQLVRIKTSPKYYLIGLMLIYGLLFSLTSLNEYFVELLELMGYTRQVTELPDTSGGMVVLVILLVAVVPAVFEELLFRGIILNNAEGEVGSVKTIFIIGFLFSLYHGSAEQTIYQFICGCLFTLLAVRSRSILPTMLIHFVNNALIIILYACGLVDGQTGNLILSQGWQLGLTISSALCLVGAVVWLILDKKPVFASQKSGVKNIFVGASVGICVMIVLWISNLL